jgi:hypothetical protein
MPQIIKLILPDINENKEIKVVTGRMHPYCPPVA